MNFPNRKYKIIYADPPWKYQGKMIKGMYVTRHYPVLSLDELKKLPIKDIADKEAAQKAAVKAASVKQKGDKYMVDPSVGAIELPDRGSDDEVDLTTDDQSTLDAVKTKYQDYLRYKPSGADARDYMRLLLKKYKLPPNTKPFKAPPSQQS